MKQKITMIILFIGLNVIAQTQFKKGYFISLDGEKTECLIKNEDWTHVPREFKYKLSKNSIVKNIKKEKIKELSIFNEFLFERHTVSLNKYSNKPNKLSSKRTSDFTQENLLLKVLLAGKTSLLIHNNKNVNYFFYKKNDEIKPLEFKLYKLRNGNIGKNLNYRKTLRENLNCIDNNLNSNISYKESNLVKYFMKYNSCHNSNSNIYSKSLKKGKLNLRAKAGIGKLNGINNNRDNIYKFVTEFEYLLPTNKQNLSFFLEFTYISISTTIEKMVIGYVTKTVPSSGILVKKPIFSNSGADVKFNSFEIPFGIRYYNKLNKKNKIFYNIGAAIDISSSNSTNFHDITQDNISLDPINKINLFSYFIGIGYEFNNKYGIELRYNEPKETSYSMRDHLNIEAESLFLKFSYNFL